MKKHTIINSFCLTLIIFGIICSCFYFHTDVRPLTKDRINQYKAYKITNPTKAHLIDGSLIVYENGFRMKDNLLSGTGIKYDLNRKAAPFRIISVDSIAKIIYYDKTLTKSITPDDFEGSVHLPTRIQLLDNTLIMANQGIDREGNNILCRSNASASLIQVPLDSVLALEYYKRAWQFAPTILTIPALVPPVSLLLVAIFGSCPTIYSCDGENYYLEAEAFSYSIAKMFESSDLDRLDNGKEINGTYSIKVTNEALETHYINLLSVLTVEHSKEYEAFPTKDDKIVLFGKESKIVRASSKISDNIIDLISERDDNWYQSDSSILKQLTQSVTEDWLDISVEVPDSADKLVLALKIRNTLLNTILLYDLMLDSQDAKAIDWLGSKTSNWFYAWRFYNWYKKYFGLRIQLYDGKEYREITRISDTGPIVWHQEAVELDVKRGELAKIRLSFLPDNWAIDWIGISFDTHENYKSQLHSCSEIRNLNNKNEDDLLKLFSEKDDTYLVTYPGQEYILDFNINPVSEKYKYTYFVKSHGFYIEWLRQQWLRQESTNLSDLPEFELNDYTIMKTAQLWLDKKSSFEKQFYESRIPNIR